MDERNNPPASFNITNASGGPESVDAGRGLHDTAVIYFGSVARVREGFALALDLMGLTAEATNATSTGRPNQDDA